jgi:hypothetical protein
VIFDSSFAVVNFDSFAVVVIFDSFAVVNFDVPLLL